MTQPNLTTNEVTSLVRHINQAAPADQTQLRGLLAANMSVPLDVALSLRPKQGNPYWAACYLSRSDVGPVEVQEHVDTFDTSQLMTFMAYARNYPRLRKTALRNFLTLDPYGALKRLHWLDDGDDLSFAVEALAATEPAAAGGRLAPVLEEFVFQLTREQEEALFDCTERPALLAHLASRCSTRRNEDFYWASTPKRVARLVELVVLNPQLGVAEPGYDEQGAAGGGELPFDAVLRQVGAYATLAERRRCAEFLRSRVSGAYAQKAAAFLRLEVLHDDAGLMSTPVQKLEEHLRTARAPSSLGSALSSLDDIQFATFVRLGAGFSGTLDELLVVAESAGSAGVSN